MSIKDIDTNDLIEELAIRGIDVRLLEDFTNEEIYDDLARRRKKLDQQIAAYTNNLFKDAE